MLLDGVDEAEEERGPATISLSAASVSVRAHRHL